MAGAGADTASARAHSDALNHHATKTYKPEKTEEGASCSPPAQSSREWPRCGRVKAAKRSYPLLQTRTRLCPSHQDFASSCNSQTSLQSLSVRLFHARHARNTTNSVVEVIHRSSPGSPRRKHPWWRKGTAKASDAWHVLHARRKSVRQSGHQPNACRQQRRSPCDAHIRLRI